MDDLLRPITTVKGLNNPQRQQKKILVQDISTLSIHDHEDAIRILKDSPNQKQLESVLDYLKKERRDGSDGKVSSTRQAQITNVLVTQTIPDWWEQLGDDDDLVNLKISLVDCLRDITALGALVSKIRILTIACKEKKQSADHSSSRAQLESLLSSVDAVLSPDDLVSRIYRNNT